MDITDDDHNLQDDGSLAGIVDNDDDGSLQDDGSLAALDDDDDDDGSLADISENSDNDCIDNGRASSVQSLPLFSDISANQLCNVTNRWTNRWQNMAPEQKIQANKKNAINRKLARLKDKLANQKTKTRELLAEMKVILKSSSMGPLTSRDDQIKYLEEMLGKETHYDLLTDVELKLKYTSAYIIRNAMPKKTTISAFRKGYKKQYLE